MTFNYQLPTDYLNDVRNVSAFGDSANIGISTVPIFLATSNFVATISSGLVTPAGTVVAAPVYVPHTMSIQHAAFATLISSGTGQLPADIVDVRVGIWNIDAPGSTILTNVATSSNLVSTSAPNATTDNSRFYKASGVTVNTTQGSASATLVVNAPSSGGFCFGQTVTAASGFSSGTYIVGISGSGPYTLTLSSATTSAISSGTALTIGPNITLDTRRNMGAFVVPRHSQLTTPQPAFASPVTLTGGSYYYAGVWAGGSASSVTWRMLSTAYMGTYNGYPLAGPKANNSLTAPSIGTTYANNVSLTNGTTLPTLGTNNSGATISLQLTT